MKIWGKRQSRRQVLKRDEKIEAGIAHSCTHPFPSSLLTVV